MKSAAERPTFGSIPITAPQGRSAENGRKEVICMSSPDGGIPGPMTEYHIGGTTYVVTSTYSKNATETAVQKMRRLILKDADKVLKNPK